MTAPSAGKQTAQGTRCPAYHDHNGKTGMAMYDILTINGRRYTVCAHPTHGVGDYCGALIDVTDAPAVVICCGNERNHG